MEWSWLISLQRAGLSKGDKGMLWYYSGLLLSKIIKIVFHRCRIDECDPENTAPTFLPLWIDNSVPFESGVPSKCTRYKLRSSNDTSTPYVDNNSKNSNSSPVCPANMFDQTTTESCNEFVYKTEERTIATEVSRENLYWKINWFWIELKITKFFGKCRLYCSTKRKLDFAQLMFIVSGIFKAYQE